MRLQWAPELRFWYRVGAAAVDGHHAAEAWSVRAVALPNAGPCDRHRPRSARMRGADQEGHLSETVPVAHSLRQRTRRSRHEEEETTQRGSRVGVPMCGFPVLCSRRIEAADRPGCLASPYASATDRSCAHCDIGAEGSVALWTHPRGDNGDSCRLREQTEPLRVCTVSSSRVEWTRDERRFSCRTEPFRTRFTFVPRTAIVVTRR